MSMWEQKASQLRRQNQASCEALYEPDQSAYLPSALHTHPEMKTHLDRPLVVGRRDLLSGHQHHCHKPCPSAEAETAADPLLTSHRHPRDKDWTQVNNETNNNVHGSKDRRHHIHHNHSKDHDSNRGKEENGERPHSKEGRRRHRRRRRHHHQSSVDDSAGMGPTSEKEHHRHHSHRQSRGGNGTVEGIGEQRSCPKDGSNRDRSTRGASRANGERRRRRTHGSRSQSKDEGEESDGREKIHADR